MFSRLSIMQAERNHPSRLNCPASGKGSAFSSQQKSSLGMGTKEYKVSKILLVANKIISTNGKVPSPEELRMHGASPIVTRWWRKLHSSTNLNTQWIIRSFFEKFRISVLEYFIMMSIFNDNIFCSETDYFTNVSLTFSEAKLLLDNSFYVSSEIERITEYEKGFPGFFCSLYFGRISFVIDS